MNKALIVVRSLGHDFPAGDGVVAALTEVDFSIEAGEMVAIMGPSGSGKSTLMNILGCLSRPTRGSYRFAGCEVGEMTPEQLASLRREHFGFVFQRYQLLGALSAISNVEVPAIYAGLPAARRHQRARQLLERLGLGSRLDHRPGQLSGGQQQRVSIARALMNGGAVILADEPTGALDSVSGREVMAILKELNAHGHTVILVTHDAQVALHADRVIKLADGRVRSDERCRERPATLPMNVHPPHVASALRDLVGRVAEATRTALRAMAAHRLRTLLTMLGIIIGIASVVSVVALGDGAREKIRADIGTLGTNTIQVMPGSGPGDIRSSAVRTLRISDADAVAKLGYVDAASPIVSANLTVRHGSETLAANVLGVGEQFFRVLGYALASGQAFDGSAVTKRAQEAVIDDNTSKALFPNGGNPLGQVILLGKVPVRIVGITAKKSSVFGNDDSLKIWIPYTTATTRLTGDDNLRSITVRVSDSAPMDAAREGITNLIKQRHDRADFYLMDTDSIRRTIEQTTATIALVISSIALISLVVGGIGIMNIMLVSVIERTQEIGVRMAVGARKGDILRQFLIEAVLVCLIGGALGVGLAFVIGAVFGALSSDIHIVFSTFSIVGAFAVCTLIGVVFGLLPARIAAALDPVEALARE